MQERLFDGHAVEYRQARVSGSFDLSDAEAERLGLDRMGIVVMAVYVGGATVKILPNGDVRRVDQLSVSEAKVLSGARYDQAREWLMADSAQLDLFRKEAPRESDGPTNVDKITGEVALEDVPAELDQAEPETIVEDDVDDEIFSPNVRRSRDETLMRFLEEAR